MQFSAVNCEIHAKFITFQFTFTNIHTIERNNDVHFDAIITNKTFLPRQRNSHEEVRLAQDGRRETYRSNGGRGRSNGSYRHNNRGAKRPSGLENDPE